MDILFFVTDQTIVQGQFRINQRNYEEAFINNPEGTEFPDIAILGMQDRNRALHGDVVAVSVKPRFSWVVSVHSFDWFLPLALQQSGLRLILFIA